MTNRRQFLRNTAAAVAGMSVPLWALPKTAFGKDSLRLVIVGSGVAGTQLAQLLQHESAIQMTVFDHTPRSTSLKDSPELGSEKGIRSRPHAMRIIHERVLSIDPVGRYVMDASGTLHGYDRLVLATGIAYDYGAYEQVDRSIPAGWMRGPESAQISAQLHGMADGGVVAVTVPRRPYRYTEGPYLRALRISRWLKTHRPASKVLLVDENPVDAFGDSLMTGIASMMDDARGIEWIRGAAIQSAVRHVAGFELATVDGRIVSQVLNFIPRQRASELLERTSLTDGDWCPRCPETLVSTRVDGVYILGDAAWETESHQKRAVNAQRDAVKLARLLTSEVS